MCSNWDVRKRILALVEMESAEKGKNEKKKKDEKSIEKQKER